MYLCANKPQKPLQYAETLKEFSHKNVAKQPNWHLHKRIIKVAIHAFPVLCCTSKKEKSQKDWKNFPVCIKFCIWLINNCQFLGKINFRKLSTTGFLAHSYYLSFSSVYIWMSFSNNFDIIYQTQGKVFHQVFSLNLYSGFPFSSKTNIGLDLICWTIIVK